MKIAVSQRSRALGESESFIIREALRTYFDGLNQPVPSIPNLSGETLKVSYKKSKTQSG